MRTFPVPFDLKEEDKIIGGYISLRQFAWITLPVAVLILEFMVFKGYISKDLNGIHVFVLGIIFRLIIFLISAVIALIMAFVKKNDMYYDRYLRFKIEYKFKKHIYTSDRK